MQKRTRITLWIGLLLLALILAAAWIVVNPFAYLPHTKITVIVPFRIDDTPATMIPMGETIYHPKPKVPHGHPGIDFLWTSGTSHDMVAAAPAKVTSITVGKSEPEKYDVELRSGVYLLRYKEMEDTAGGLHVGQHLQQGDLVGHAGHYCDTSGAGGAKNCWFNIHWELASTSLLRDRFCPVTYFTAPSRGALEALWNSVPANDKIKSQFPNICSGDYAGKAE